MYQQISQTYDNAALKVLRNHNSKPKGDDDTISNVSSVNEDWE